MTKDEKLKEIRDAVVKVMPEINGSHVFEIGYHRCRFCNELRITRDRRAVVLAIDEKTGGSITDVTETSYDITDMPCSLNHYRHVNLEDILKTLEKNAVTGSGYRLGVGYFGDYLLTCQGKFVYYKEDRELDFKATWTVGQPLHLQPDVTIDFIHSIICRKV